MLTIVHTLYLSSKSLFTHRQRDENEEYDGGAMYGASLGVIAC